MAGYVPLPQYQPNALINFAPVNNALSEVASQNNTNRMFGLQQQASDRADQSLALQKQSVAADLRNSALNYEKGLATLTGGVAQSALTLKDPAARAQVWNGIVSSHPEFGKTLQAHGIDANDADAGLSFLVNEARGYQNPLDVQAKQAEIASTRSTTALNEQKQKLAQRQFDFTSQLINGAKGGAPAAAMPNVGDVDSGYRFKGGNPADPNSWEAAQ